MNHSSLGGTRSALALATLMGLFGCTHLQTSEPAPETRPELIHAITADLALIQFNAGNPTQILSRKPLSGLASGESVAGMDYRVAQGVLYVLADSGQLYTADTTSGKLTPVGKAKPGASLKGQAVGVDFNPTVDRIRVVTDAGQNWRMHPDTGAWVDADPKTDGLQSDAALAFAKDDVNAGKSARITAAGYTYNKTNEKITTNYALDVATGSLVTMGSKEGVTPPVSPNTGQLRTVGSLGVGALKDASFDISDARNAALAALHDGRRVRLYEINLGDGKARLLGTVGQGQAILGMAIAP